MTDIDRSAAQADLAFLRQLVDEEDWRRPARFFGATYVAIGLAIVAQIIVTDVVTTDMSSLATLIGIVAVWVLYGLAQTVINLRLSPGKPGASLRSRATATGFIGMVLSHLSLLIVFLITAILQQDVIFMKLAALSFFALQGGLWLTLHAMRRDRWHLFVALGWMAAAIVVAPLIGGSPFGYAVGLVVLFLMVLPGTYILVSARNRA